MADNGGIQTRMFDLKKGIEVLQENVKLAPEKPGVYRMLNDKDEVLYVGKAKNIKKRIIAYTRVEQLTIRLQRMVAEVKKMEFIIVENENRALIVENELIKKYNPHFINMKGGFFNEKIYTINNYIISNFNIK